MSPWPQGYRKTVYRELDSSNTQARRAAEAGEKGPLWILAERQSAGRGRRGRVWHTAEGNLAATLLLWPKASALCGQLSFAAALAVADMAETFCPDTALRLKWPNDVLAEGRKLAGILLESGVTGDGTWLAIGIGVNLASYPDDSEFPATALAALNPPAPSPEDALGILAVRFACWYDLWMQEGFESLRTAWLARAAQLGAPIRARLAQETQDGIFQGIDGAGALLLNQQGRVRRITAGEVFF